MITAGTLSNQPSRLVRLLSVAALVWVSLLAAGLAIYLGWMSIGVAAAMALVGVTVWRPRVGLYVGIVLTFLFEAHWRGPDPFTSIGWMIQFDVSSWSPIRAIKFSPLELLFILIALGILGHAIVERRGLRPMQIFWPVLLFTAAMAASAGWGIATGGDYKVSLFETRSLFLAMFVAMLVPTLLPRREHVDRAMMLAVISVVLLSVEIIWRRLVILNGVTYLDDQFQHESPVLMNFVVVFLLARLIWPTSGRQRWSALLIPLILVAEMLTERRAGWLGLDVGIMLLCAVIFQLQRKLFICLVLPLGLVYLGYLGAFWNANPSSSLAQPARAVRSIVSPDPRDAQSNDYRVVETSDIRLNIRAHPITGLGFGHEFIFYNPLPDLSGNWPFYRYTPHNSFLWIWMKMGPLGFALFLVMIGAGSARGMQLLKDPTNRESIPILVALVGALLMLVVYTYVDVALTNPRTALLLGLAIGTIGAWGNQLGASQEHKA